MSLKTVITLAGLLVVFAARAELTPAEALTGKLSELTSLSGQFEQVLYDSDGSELERSSGEFVVQKPGRFHWETTEPFPQLLVSDGETIWLYDPDLLQVTVRPLEPRGQRSPVHLLSQSARSLSEDYRVERADPETFTLIPNAAEPMFESLTIHFDGESITEISVTDSLERRTRFGFSSLTLNQPVDENLFSFEPPEGVDVLID